MDLSSTKQDFIASFRDLLNYTIKHASRNNHYLFKAVNSPIFNTAFITFFINNKFEENVGVNLDIDELRGSFNIFGFLPPPVVITSEYKDHVKKQSDFQTEFYLEQPASKKQKVSSKVFANGGQSSVEDIISSIANFVTFCSSIVCLDIEKEVPLVITKLKELAEFVSNNSVKFFVNKKK